MGRRLAVLHHGTSFHPPDVRRAVEGTADLLWVLPDAPPDDEFGRRLIRRFGTLVEISTADLDAAARTLAAAQPDGIVTFVDDHLVLAAELAARLGLPYHTPEVAARLANKQLQREALRRAGVPGPRHWPLPAGLDAAELLARGAELPYPCVLKPAFGSGSRGIVGVASAADLVRAYRPEIEQIAEEYLPDDPHADPRFASYLSVETVVSRGGRDHAAITGRFPLAEPFRETGNFIPAAVDAVMHRPLLELTDAAIDALGVETGVLHTEIKLTPQGPQLIELNGRLGGRPPFVLRDVSAVNLFRAVVDVALGREVSSTGMAACDGVGYWLMLQPPRAARRVLTVAGLDEIGRAPFVDSVDLKKTPGEPVDWRDGTAGHVVVVRGRVPDLETLADAVTAIERTVSIGYEIERPLDSEYGRHSLAS